MALIIFVVFIFVWYFPVWLRQGKEDRLPGKTIPLTILLGMIPAFLAIIALQVLFGFVQRALTLPYYATKFISAFVSASLIEEFVKFFFAWLVIRKVQPRRKVDYVLIFGAVGLGYEITESLLLMDSPVTGIVRGLFAMHIILQFWMGWYFWEACRAKEAGDVKRTSKNMLLAFGVPFFMHGMNDFCMFIMEDLLKNTDQAALASGQVTPELEKLGVWTLVVLIFLVLELVFQIVTYCKALKASRESRAVSAD